MDYLDPRKAHRHRILLFVGYGCIAIAIGIASLILVYLAYGFGLGKNGTVIQNGLAFFSSQPSPANIYVNGTLNKSKTNARLVLPEGIYKIRLTREGYRDWQRTIEMDGGSVEHFDYPLLIPTKPITKKIATYTASPGLMTQSPDRRWLLVAQAGSLTAFDVYDLKNPAKAPVTVSLPNGVLTDAASTEGESWQLGEWADDNQHVLLQHVYDGKTEYVLLNRSDPAEALNLNSTLSVSPTQLTLNDKKYDQYYIYTTADATLRSATLKAPTPVPVLDHVLAYKSYGNKDVLYATDSDAPAGKVLIKLRANDQTYTIRSFPAGTNYLLDLTQYSGKLYVVAGATAQDRAYIYRDPVGQLRDQPKQAAVPAQVLHVSAPNYLSFSTNAQFIVAEDAAQFSVYDIENKQGYTYTTPLSLDAPQAHASWMDGNRLTYVSGGKMTIFDYDNNNRQQLVAEASTFIPAFSPDYKFVYTLSPTSGGQLELAQSSLLTSADQ